MKIERATTKKHMEMLRLLVRECFGEEILPEEKWFNLLENDKYRIWIGLEKDLPIGFVSFMKVLTLQYEAYWVDLIGVLPTHQNRGVGRALISHGEGEIAKECPDFISALIANQNSSSERAFEKSGYRKDKGFHLYFKEISSEK